MSSGSATFCPPRALLDELGVSDLLAIADARVSRTVKAASAEEATQRRVLYQCAAMFSGTSENNKKKRFCSLKHTADTENC
jgi:hypothetical protein